MSPLYIPVPQTYFYNIQDPEFGGDPTLADNSDAINRAYAKASANGGGRLIASGGIYKFQKPLQIPSTTGFLGVGEGKTQLQWLGPPGIDAVEIIGASNNRKSNILFEDLSILGSCGSGSGKLVDVQYADSVLFSRTTLNSQGSSATDGAALFIGNVNKIRVDNSTLLSSAVYCLYHNSSAPDEDIKIYGHTKLASTYATPAIGGIISLFANSGCKDFAVEDCQIGPGLMSGVSCQGDYNGVGLNRNTVRGIYGMGLEASHGPRQVGIADNIIDYLSSLGINSQAFAISGGGDGLNITSNKIWGIIGVGYGIEIVDANDANALANIIRGVDEGIIANGSNRVNLIGNNLRDLQFRGIRVYSPAATTADDANIIGNTIKDCGLSTGTIPGGAGQGIAAIDVDLGGGSAKRATIGSNKIFGVHVNPTALYTHGIQVNDIDAIILPNSIVGVDGGNTEYNILAQPKTFAPEIYVQPAAPATAIEGAVWFQG